jgi:hypothetical protein
MTIRVTMWMVRDAKEGTLLPIITPDFRLGYRPY